MCNQPIKFNPQHSQGPLSLATSDPWAQSQVKSWAQSYVVPQTTESRKPIATEHSYMKDTLHIATIKSQNAVNLPKALLSFLADTVSWRQLSCTFLRVDNWEIGSQLIWYFIGGLPFPCIEEMLHFPRMLPEVWLSRLLLCVSPWHCIIIIHQYGCPECHYVTSNNIFALLLGAHWQLWVSDYSV